MSCRTGRCKKLSLIFALFVMAVIVLRPTPASAAGNCLADVDSTIAKHLGGSTCTANDVRLAEALNPRDPLGNPVTTCFAGVPFSFIADFQVITTATQREDIGLYMAIDGHGSAETSGSCVDNIISPLHWPGAPTTTNPNFCAGCAPPNNQQVCSTNPNSGLVQCLGSALYHANTSPDQPGDNCGDTTSADGTNQFITIAVNNIICPAVGTTFVLPNCTTWYQNTGTIPLCFSDPSSGWPFNSNAQAGTTSKCNCSNLTIPITPINYSMTATKTPNPSSYTDAAGGSFVYTVGVTNGTSLGGGFASETITQVCDDRYGNIGTVRACSGGSNAGNVCTAAADCPSGTCVPASPACAAGTQCAAPNNVAGGTCATAINCTLPQQVAGGATNTDLCHFTGAFNPGGTGGSLKDTVTVNGFGDNGQSSPPGVSASANATVTVAEAPATVNVTKSLDSTFECATVRYKVEVDNTSGSTTDESEVLSDLEDTVYGNVSQTGVHVLGTTCNQTTGQGSLAPVCNTTTSTCTSGKFGATCAQNSDCAVTGGTYGTINPGGSYICEFDGQFCGGLTSHGTCAQGLEETNTVTATVADDDSEGSPVTGNKASTLKVDVCFTHTP